MNSQVIETYIDSLLERSTPEIPVWNIEKALAGKKSGWDYIDGCMIMAILEIYQLTGNKKYLTFADSYIDFRINEDGSIDGYDINEWNLDEINGAKNLFTLYDLTGKEKYRKAIDTVYEQIKKQPRTKAGNFWHKAIYPNQVWLDGLYMALPFYMEYEVNFTNGKNRSDIYKQFFTVASIMKNQETGLYYHCYDETKSIFWANPDTGLSKHYWLRALGWYSMALLDTLDKDDIGKENQDTNWTRLKHIFVDLMNSMITYQDKSGMWYQVPDCGNREKNYLETSGTSIMAYCLFKAVRLGFLPQSYTTQANKAFMGVCNTYLTTENDTLHLGGICLMAGLGPENNPKRDGTFEYYMGEPIVKDDAKGVGPFILAYSEWKASQEK